MDAAVAGDFWFASSWPRFSASTLSLPVLLPASLRLSTLACGVSALAASAGAAAPSSRVMAMAYDFMLVLQGGQHGGSGGVASLPQRLARCCGLLTLLLAAGCSTVAVTPPVRPLPSDVAFAWPSVLDQAVDDAGRVDYRRIAAAHGALDVAAAAVGQADLAAMPRRERLAFLINASNTLWTLGIVRDGVPDRLGPVGRLDSMRLEHFIVAGREMTLDALQKDLILPLASGPSGDWRVPLALYCPAVSCPRLAHTAYAAADLDAQLDMAARRFLSDPANVAVDPAARVVRVSGVMGRTPGLIRTVNRYRGGAPVPEDYRVEALPFEWTVVTAPDLHIVKPTHVSN